MKSLFVFAVLFFSTFSCVNKSVTTDQKSIAQETSTNRIFKQVHDFPIIKDSSSFISELRKTFKLEVDESPFQKANEKITTFKKVKIYGSNDDFYFIEYDDREGCGAAYPWKCQVILTSDGKLVKTLTESRFEFIEIFKKENPFLLTVSATSKGNGGHSFYKISADTLENVFENDFDYFLKTYDAHEDNSINEPYELTCKVNDFNLDGLNDISFYGNIVLTKGRTQSGEWFDSETIKGKVLFYSANHPFKKIPVEFIFLYDKTTGHFKAMKDYSKIYKSSLD